MHFAQQKFFFTRKLLLDIDEYFHFMQKGLEFFDESTLLS